MLRCTITQNLDIGRRLARELEDARHKYDNAMKRFDAMMGTVLSGLPYQFSTCQVTHESRQPNSAMASEVDFIQKPFTRQKLVARLREVLNAGNS